MRSSPLAMESAAEQDDLSIERYQAEMEVTPADPDQASPLLVIPIPSDVSTPEPLPQSRLSPRPTRELRPTTKWIARAT
jgi:hypothetical protein